VTAPGHPPGHRGQRWLTTLDSHRLRHLRRQRGLSQAALAALAGISSATITRLEQGRSHTPCRTRTLARLAAALGEDPARLACTAHDSPPR
jgi:transcriptional regulator with XRE-family HTH domain